METHVAQIHTRTVKIKTVTVEGRKMTLGTFKQIPFAREVSASGEPWGWVNQFWQDWAPGFPQYEKTGRRQPAAASLR